MGNLRVTHTNQRDVSFATQRSDDWEFWDVPYLESLADKGKSRVSQEKVRKVLKFIDLERSIKDAERVIEANKEQYSELKKTFPSP